MFSKKIVLIVIAIIMIVVNIILLSLTSSRYSFYNPTQVAFFFIAPVQKAVTHSFKFCKNIWGHYFCLVSVAKKNDTLQKTLSHEINKNNNYREIKAANFRLRNLLRFRKTITNHFLVAEVVGRDPSPWFKTVIIDKGKSDGLEKGLPVVMPQGIIGQIIEISGNYSKVLLMIDPNSAVDALVQRTRGRGIINGQSDGICLLKYVLRKNDIKVGDSVISSGLDGIFPKGLRVGYISEIIKLKSSIFQEVTVTPYVDFEKLEEVIVLLYSTKNDFVSEQ